MIKPSTKLTCDATHVLLMCCTRHCVKPRQPGPATHIPAAPFWVEAFCRCLPDWPGGASLLTARVTCCVAFCFAAGIGGVTSAGTLQPAVVLRLFAAGGAAAFACPAVTPRCLLVRCAGAVSSITAHSCCTAVAAAGCLCAGAAAAVTLTGRVPETGADTAASTASEDPVVFLRLFRSLSVAAVAAAAVVAAASSAAAAATTAAVGLSAPAASFLFLLTTGTVAAFGAGTDTGATGVASLLALRREVSAAAGTFCCSCGGSGADLPLRFASRSALSLIDTSLLVSLAVAAPTAAPRVVRAA